MSNLKLIPIQIFALLYAIVIHEFSHGYAAYKMGDKTAYYQGRLTLNPIPHIDLFGTIIFPGALILFGSPVVFGWAKPVPVNPNNYKDYVKGKIFVSLAGPGSNLLSAIVFTILYYIVTPANNMPTNVIGLMLFLMILINLALFAFNLIPIPPLDGSHVLEVLLPPRYKRKYNQITQYGFIILLGLLFLNIINYYISFIISFYGMVSGLPIWHILQNAG